MRNPKEAKEYTISLCINRSFYGEENAGILVRKILNEFIGSDEVRHAFIDSKYMKTNDIQYTLGVYDYDGKRVSAEDRIYKKVVEVIDEHSDGLLFQPSLRP